MSSSEKPRKKLRGKVVMIGDSGVGKTSILLRHDGQGFASCISTTYNASFLSSKIQTSRGDVELNMWDTAGQERFRSMLPMYTRNAVGAILVFDTTRYGSFRNLDYWMNELTRHVPNKVFKYVMGNKSDLQSFRVISETEAQDWARSHEAAYFETSALSGRGIDLAMRTIAENLAEYHLLTGDESQPATGNSIVDCDEEESNDKSKSVKRACCTIS